MTGLTGNNILAGSSGQVSGYEIEQSLRFEDGDSAYLSRTPGSAGNRKTWTWSGWFKLGIVDGSYRTIFGAGGGTNRDRIQIFNDEQLVVNFNDGLDANLNTTQVFRDPSAWYHLVVAVDTTQATSSNRIKIYVNGEQVTAFDTASYPSQNYDTRLNNNIATYIGQSSSNNFYWDGYLAEVNFVDGQALDPSNFGETDLFTNQWIPKKYVGTYGTNGFYLNFGNSASLGADSSGNSNNFTPTNLAATDQVLDSPTNNFAVLADVNNPTDIYLEGRLKFQGLTSATSPYSTSVLGSFGVSSGKWYYEARANTFLNGVRIGFARDGEMSSDGSIPTYRVFDFDIWDNLVTTNNSYTNDFTVTGSAGDILGLAIDIDNGTASAYINGTLKGSVTGLNTSGYQNLPFSRLGYASGGPTLTMNFGQDSSFAGTETAQNNTDGRGKGDFYYAPPSGYLALCEDNLPDPSIALPGEHFNTVLYSGNSTSQSITGVGFQPDFTWLKSRSAAGNHRLHNVITYGGPISGGSSGIKYLESNTTNAETSSTTKTLISLDSDGFSLYGDGGDTNQSSITYTSWNWKADNTSGSSNTDGTITSTVSANPTAGFSIVKFVNASGTNQETVGHGLSQSPDLIISKNLDTNVNNWAVFHSSVCDTTSKFIQLNTSNAITTYSTVWGASLPTASVFGVTGGGIAAASVNVIAYCFHSVEGYSKFGSYTGNGNADGTFIYLGFRPSFVLVKSTGVEDWFMYDGKRDPINVADKRLKANATSTEATVVGVDFLSNGFKWRGTTAGFNQSGVTFIYMAFAESPFKYSTAR